jgi:hypothetical protein
VQRQLRGAVHVVRALVCPSNISHLDLTVTQVQTFSPHDHAQARGHFLGCAANAHEFEFGSGTQKVLAIDEAA